MDESKRRLLYNSFCDFNYVFFAFIFNENKYKKAKEWKETENEKHT